MALEILITLFALIGVAACVRLVMGVLLYPVQGAWILLPAQGDGSDLEHRIRGLRALSEEGRLSDTEIYLLDLGLNDAGLSVAEQLCTNWTNVHYCIPTPEDTIT